MKKPKATPMPTHGKPLSETELAAVKKEKARFEVFERKSGPTWAPLFMRKSRWYWRLVAGNGEIIAVGSEPFYSVENAVRATETVRAIAAKAEVKIG